MPILHIRPLRVNAKIDPDFAVPPDRVVLKQTANISVIEKGVVGGKTSLLFHFRDETGKSYVWETTAALVETLVGSVRGSEGFWKENPIE